MEGLHNPSSTGSFPSTFSFSLSLIGTTDGMRMDEVGEKTIEISPHKQHL